MSFVRVLGEEIRFLVPSPIGLQRTHVGGYSKVAVVRLYFTLVETYAEGFSP